MVSTAAPPFPSLLAKWEGPRFSTPSLTLAIFCLGIILLFEVASHCGFDLRFPSD